MLSGILNMLSFIQWRNLSENVGKTKSFISKENTSIRVSIVLQSEAKS